MSSMETPELKSSVLTLFRKDVIAYGIKLENLLLALQSNIQDKQSIKELIRIANLIRGASLIVHYDSIAETAKALGEYFLKIQEKAPQSPVDLSIFFKVAEKLKMIGNVDDKMLQDHLKTSDEDYERLASAILEMTSAQNRKIEKPAFSKISEDKALSISSTIPQVPREELDVIIDPQVINLFRIDLENQTKILINSIISLERRERIEENLQEALRAVHSIKGAARIVRINSIIQLAHIFEDLLVAGQKKTDVISEGHFDTLLKAADVFAHLASLSPELMSDWLEQQKGYIKNLITDITAILSKVFSQTQEIEAESQISNPPSNFPAEKTSEKAQEKVLRVTAQSLSSLMELVGEFLVESRRLYPFNESMFGLKKNFHELSVLIEILNRNLEDKKINVTEENFVQLLRGKSNECGQLLNKRLSELTTYITRNSILSDRLYHEVIDSRMRPFGDIVAGFPRMVRDLAQHVNKKIKLEIAGKSTSVDRDILEVLEAPLIHLLRNAIDHGIEPPETRMSLGKPAEGLVRIEAQHKAGMLEISVFDDGAGVNIEEIRKKIVDKRLTSPETAAKLSEPELIDFLFMSGFSTAAEVSEISGRGVGLNAVQNVVRGVSGKIHAAIIPGKGMSFNLQLPLTISVKRCLVAEISSETFAFPLADIEKVMLLPQEKIVMVENRHYFAFEGQNIGLIPGWQILELDEVSISSTLIPVILIRDRRDIFGLVVDKFLGEKELVVLNLDSRLGKIPDISAGAIMQDGTPVLMVDAESMAHTIGASLAAGHTNKLTYSLKLSPTKKIKRVLVIDDSVIVREVESRLLRNSGYEVETAINGRDGWNALKTGSYDLVVTDIDMPEMNGIELVRAIRADLILKTLPVIIVSYKDNAKPGKEGIETGANAYLTKSSFQDETLLSAVKELIGAPAAAAGF